MSFAIGVFCGLFIGGFFGALAVAAFVVARNADRHVMEIERVNFRARRMP